MAQQTLIYSFVARGTGILAEYTGFSGNFTSIASQCLQKLPATNNKFTYNCDGHTFNYLVDNGFTYCVVAVESAGRQVPIAFLERVKEDFNKRYGGGKAATAVANSLNREFGPKLKEHMQYCVDHPEEISKLAKVKAQVSEVKGVMMENIEKVLDRGEKIELLVDKTENLRSQAQDFRQQGTKMRRKMWLQNMKIKLIVLGVINGCESNVERQTRTRDYHHFVKPYKLFPSHACISISRMSNTTSSTCTTNSTGHADCYKTDRTPNPFNTTKPTRPPMLPSPFTLPIPPPALLPSPHTSGRAIENRESNGPANAGKTADSAAVGNKVILVTGASGAGALLASTTL